ncbi:MAG: hypothetical protein JXR35_00935 [Rhodobacteraceae bacterium]|nr:hypothetical protein [Paracoccaceae bacterium]
MNDIVLAKVNAPRPADAELDRFVKFRLVELTFHYSLDSYKAPALNSPFIAQELLGLIKIVRETGKGKGEIPLVLEELRHRLSSDPVAAVLIGISIQGVLPDNVEDSPDFESRVGAIAARLNPLAYLSALESALDDELKSPKPSKETVDHIISNLVTTKINLGMSSSFIHAVSKRSFNPKSPKTTAEKAAEFLSETALLRSNYKVILRADIRSDGVRHDHYNAFDIQLPDRMPDEFKVKPRPGRAEDMLEENGTKKLVIIDGINATDPHAAVHKSIKKMQHLFDLVAIFDHKSNVSIEANARALNTDDNKCYRVHSLRNRMTFIDEGQTKRTLGDLDSFLSNLKFSDRRELSKFLRAITLHGQAITTSSEEAQLLNLWTAMEIVGRNMRKTSIVEDVAGSLLPVISLGYPTRIVDAWAKRAEVNSKEFVDFCKERSDVSNWKIAFILKTMKEEDHREACRILKNSPALLFRGFTIGKRFGTPKHLLEDLSRHEKFVCWQIHRIYRARNIITHSGASPTYCGALVDNAHDYLDQVLTELGRNLCSDRPFGTISDMLTFAEVQLSTWRSTLKSKEQWDQAGGLFSPPAW